MGCFSCFDSKEDEKLNPNPHQETHHHHRDHDHDHNLPSHVSRLPSASAGADKLRPTSNGASKGELPALKDGPAVQIAAQTFTFRELAAATKNFRPQSFLGEGGFGRVYKGRLETTGQAVAVKQLDRNGLQGNREFLVEVLMLSLLHHPNLVNLIGYCADGDQRLLVYEFMPLGSLEDHLHDKNGQPGATKFLAWSGPGKGQTHYGSVVGSIMLFLQGDNSSMTQTMAFSTTQIRDYLVTLQQSQPAPRLPFGFAPLF